jgi:CheY-like chemotaxis protein
VAHDFNNVLTSISTLTQLLKGKISEEDRTLHEYINYITVASKLGQNLTSNLLLLGRRRTTNLQRVKINEIIANIDNILKVLLTEEIACNIALADNQEFVMADPHQIEQILINLATNARDAMPDGGDLAIETSVVSLEQKMKGKFMDIPVGDYMRLSVSDTGHGIKEEDLATIFEPFYSTKASNKGTGLGLAIIDNIVKQHNAYIDIESTIDEGTTFRIYFPVSTGAVSEGAQPAAEEKQEAAHPGDTILVVDDDWLIRKSLLIFLQNRGYHVLLAVDGEEALNKYMANRENISLVVLDVMLPKKDGRQVYDSIKQQDKDAKVLFISGSTEEVLREKKISGSGLEFLAKPLDIEDFGAKVDEMLKKG